MIRDFSMTLTLALCLLKILSLEDKKETIFLNKCLIIKKRIQTLKSMILDVPLYVVLFGIIKIN